MSEFIDISLPLDPHLPIWPGDDGFTLKRVKWLDRDGCNETRVNMGSHVGTHIDAPLHFVNGGGTVEHLPLENLIGPVQVVDVGDVVEISAQVLAGLNLHVNLDRLLLKTRNSLLWSAGEKVFCEDFSALTLDGAEWLVRRGLRLVGIDYLSIQRFRESNATHITLLQHDIIILEGLNLAAVMPGVYELICLPLLVVGAEGAPVRAVLRRMPPLSPLEKGHD